MAEASTSVKQQRNDERIRGKHLEETKKFEETKIEKNNGRKKENRTKNSVKFVEPEPISKSSDPIGVLVSNKQNYYKKMILKREMYDAVRETEGVWCTEVVALYWKRYGRPPELTELGFISILDLLYCMKDQLIITRSKDFCNYWICDANAPHPPPQKPEPEPEPEMKPEPEPEPVEVAWWDPCPPEPPDCSALEEDALPGVPFAPDVFPIDCLQPGETIPNVELPELDSEYLDLKVFVTALYSPSHLWFRLFGEFYNTAVEKIIDNMTEYYGQGEGVSRRLAYAAMKVGQYCAAFFQYWHRAVIVRIIDREHAKVFLVDEGLVQKLSIDDMKPLRRHWARELPAQAIRARMVGVRPPNGAQLWSRFSCEQLAYQTLRKLMIARILAVDETERVLEVNLRNPSTKQRIKRKLVITEGIELGPELIKAGYADPESRTSLENGEKFSYYYPLFDVLESGATPNYFELDWLAQNGFEPEDIPSFVKHVPPLEPIRCPTPPHLAIDIDDYTGAGALSSLDLLTSDPAMLDPVSSNPLTSEPVASDPAMLDPVSSKPVTSEPVASDPAMLDPVSSNPVTSEPVASDPAMLDPVSSKPVTLDPVMLDPVPSKPVRLNPVLSKPMTSDPVMWDPLLSNPMTSGYVMLCPVSSNPVTPGYVSLCPVFSNPMTSDPVMRDPLLSNPMTSGYVMLCPVSSNPLTPGYVRLCPVFSNPMTSDPVMRDPLLSNPMTSGYVTLGPVLSNPMTSGFVTPDSVASHPVTWDPVASDPVTWDPVASDPVTLNPGTSTTPEFVGPVVVCRRTYVTLKSRKDAARKLFF